MLRRILLGFLLAISQSSPVVGSCAIADVEAMPITKPSATIADGGGVIVAAQPAFDKVKNDGKPEQPGWRFRDGSNLTKPTIRTIAPGLAVYVLPPSGATVTLVDDNRKPLFTGRRATDKRAELAAPKVTKVKFAMTLGSGPHHSTSTRVTAGFAAAPADAVALVIYEVSKTGTTAKSWALVAPNAKELVMYSADWCSWSIPGVAPVASGTKVVLAWLDTSGRLSPMSNEIAVD